MIDWISEHYLVLISGIAVPFIYALITRIFFKKKSTKLIKQKQKSGDNSINIQAGENIEINRKDI